MIFNSVLNIKKAINKIAFLEIFLLRKRKIIKETVNKI